MASSVAGVKRPFLAMALGFDSQPSLQLIPQSSSSSSESDARGTQRPRRRSSDDSNSTPCTCLTALCSVVLSSVSFS